MARDCSDRQRGANWRNDDRRGSRPSGTGTGDAVDREYEVCILFHSGSIVLTNFPHSNLCKNSLVGHRLLSEVVQLPAQLKVGPEATTMITDPVGTVVVAMKMTTAVTEVLSPGNEALPVALRPGNVVMTEALPATPRLAPPALVEVLPHGNKVVMAAPVEALLLHGRKTTSTSPHIMVPLLTLPRTPGMLHHPHLLLCPTR